MARVRIGLIIGGLLLAVVVIGLIAARILPVNGVADAQTQFYVPEPNAGALKQIAELTSQGRTAEASLIRTILNTPTAV